MKNPYAASQTKDSEILDTPWPLVTRSQLQSALHIQAHYAESEVNQKVQRLIMARKALGDARIACSAAKRANQDVRVANQLDAITTTLSNLLEMFPLSIKEDLGKQPEPQPVKFGERPLNAEHAKAHLEEFVKDVQSKLSEGSKARLKHLLEQFRARMKQRAEQRAAHKPT